MNPMQYDEYSISIDLGTSSCKLCALDLRGNIVGSSSAVYRTHSLQSGWAEQDPETWLVAIIEAFTQLGQQVDLRRATCITLTSAAHIGVLLDATGHPVRNSLLWSDQRSRLESESLQREYGPYIFSRTCNEVSTSWTLPHLVWVREHEPRTWQQVHRLGLSKDYILYWLTGEWRTDPATALSAMLYDTTTACWSDQLCKVAGVDIMSLPEIFPASAAVGQLVQPAAGLLGLTGGVPVINGTLDSALETYGAGATQCGDVVIRIGTAGGIHIIKDSPDPDPRLLTYPFPKGGLWYSQAGTSSAGSAIAWAVGLAVEKQSAMSDTDGIVGDFLAFNCLASNVPVGSDGLLFHPYLSGERTPYWNSSLRGTFSGVSFRHGREHFARAVLEGVAFSICDASLTIAANRSLPARIKVVGGGGKSAIVMGTLAAILGREMQVLERVDSAYGAALFGLRCSGAQLEHDAVVGSGNKPVSHSHLVRPDELSTTACTLAFERYRDACCYLVGMYSDRKRS